MKKTIFLMLIMVLMAVNAVCGGSGTALPSDVAQTHWVYNALGAAATDGWLVMESKSEFRPEARATREKVALLLTKAWSTAVNNGKTSAALPSASGSLAAFSDMANVDTDTADAFKRLIAAGVFTGYPDGLMRPEGVVTRLEMAVILTKISGDPTSAQRDFTDQAQIPQWGKAYAYKAAALGLISGYPDGSFRPSQAVTNAEALQMISAYAYPQKPSIMVSRGQTEVAVDPLAAEILKGINAERSKKGLNPLRINPTLTKIAMYKSSDMAENNYFAHESPAGEGVKELYTRLGLTGWSRMGENLLKSSGSISAEKAVATWMNSDGHRANILTPYTDTGIGIARAADGTTYITQSFASF